MKDWQQILKLFQACDSARSVTQLHSIILRTGLINGAHFAAKLNHLYSKHTPLEVARKLFDETPQRTAQCWNAILRRCFTERRHEETLRVFSNMVLSSRKPDHFTISVALKACTGLKAVDFGKIIHGFVKKNCEIDSNLFVGSSLIGFYSKFGKMDDALRVFEDYSEPDVVLYTTMLTGYEQIGMPREALQFFTRMVMESGIKLDSITLVSVVSACTQLSHTKGGRSIHGFVMRKGFDKCLSLSNALLNLYAKSGLVRAAEKIFCAINGKDVISWGTMIACNAHNGAANEALRLFNKMLAEGVEPNSVAFIGAFQACEAACNLEQGQKIYELATRKGAELDVLVSTALIDMYMNCSSPNLALEIFQRMPKKDAVSWSALLCGCVQNGMAYKSMGVFRDMIGSGVQPDASVMVKVLTACSELGILQQACCLHGYVIRGGFNINAFIQASLIESYSKCGSLDDAIRIFEGLENRDIVIWSSMFASYGIHGRGRELLELFSNMIQNSAIRPNNITFLSILSACSHAGLVKEGIEVFGMMVNDYQLLPESKHYGVMVDLLGRTGELEQALQVIKQMPAPVGAHVWGALLGACRVHQNMELAEVAGKNILELEAGDAGHHVQLSHIYAVEGNWDKSAHIRSLVKRKELKKLSGQSVIDGFCVPKESN